METATMPRPWSNREKRETKASVINQEMRERHELAARMARTFLRGIEEIGPFTFARTQLTPVSRPETALVRAAEEILQCLRGERNPAAKRALFHAATRVLCIDPHTDLVTHPMENDGD